jgi:UDP-3-O-[3-hydroxymyristoyl] glucosamine N-acyltransferase
MTPSRTLPLNDSNYKVHADNIARIIAGAANINDADIKVVYYMALVTYTEPAKSEPAKSVTVPTHAEKAAAAINPVALDTILAGGGVS